MNENDEAVLLGKIAAHELLLALALASSGQDLSAQRELSNALTMLPPPDHLSDEAQDHFRASARDQVSKVVAVALAMRASS